MMGTVVVPNEEWGETEDFSSLAPNSVEMTMLIKLTS
jgi:hypothetical protein